MAKRPTTAKGILAELKGHIDASRATLTVNFGGSVVPLYLPSAGIVTGEDYAALMLDGKPYWLELDRRGNTKSAKAIASPDSATLANIARDLIPEPEEPEEVKAMREQLANLSIPKGYRLEIVKGKPTLVEDSTASNSRKRGSESSAGGKKPALSVGMTLTRHKDGYAYKVTGIDAEAKRITLAPVDGGEQSLTAGYPAPVFWRNWDVVS